MQPGEQWEAVVRYHVIGARTRRYGLGSRRGKVQTVRLWATTGGPLTFLRGSLQPSAVGRDSLRWDLTNVVTTQQIALAFPPDIERREAYLQALSALPTSLILFLIGVADRVEIPPADSSGGARGRTRIVHAGIVVGAGAGELSGRSGGSVDRASGGSVRRGESAGAAIAPGRAARRLAAHNISEPDP